MPPKLGIIAGGGGLPLEIIAECRRTGRPFFVVALLGHTDKETVTGTAHKWVRLGAAGQIVQALRRKKAVEIVLAGSVKRPSLLQLRPDFWALKFFVRTGVAYRGDNGLLQAIVKTLETREGFQVVGAHTLLPGLLADEGCLGKIEADSRALKDIRVAWAAALKLGGRDVGQGAIARHGAVLGLEGASGTAAMLAAVEPDAVDPVSGVLVKVCKPDQELRADLPTIGPSTVSQAVRAGLAGIAIEADKSLVLDKKRTIQTADEAGLFIVALKGLKE